MRGRGGLRSALPHLPPVDDAVVAAVDAQRDPPAWRLGLTGLVLSERPEKLKGPSQITKVSPRWGSESGSTRSESRSSPSPIRSSLT